MVRIVTCRPIRARAPEHAHLEAARRPTLQVVLFAAALIATMSAGCSDGSVDAPTTSTAAATEIDALLDGDAPVDVTVTGYVLWNSSGARLCAVLMESFPPQCGEPAIDITNPDVMSLALEEEQSVRWTDDRVQLTGTFDGSRLTLVEHDD